MSDTQQPPGWRIDRDDGGAMCGFHYTFSHRDYNGAPDSNDVRCGTAASWEDAVAQIREMEEDL